MPPHCLIRVGFQHGSLPFHSILLSPLPNKIPKSPRTKTLIHRMVAQSGSTKRPTCPSCSKPTRICLCNKFNSPAIHNSVAVTILQHNLEKKHPLNSARIATLGLKNVRVVTLYDVNFEARFCIRLIDPGSSFGGGNFDEECNVFDELSNRGETGDCTEGRGICEDGTILSRNSDEKSNLDVSKEVAARCFDANVATLQGFEAADINFTIEKYGYISSIDQCGTETNEPLTNSLDHILGSEVVLDYVRKGFLVKKHQRFLVEGSDEYEESEEFAISVPPGSVLLFPSEDSVEFEAVNFDVKNLIVLDGTWSKAKRMYNENPWLKLLPHVRLDLDKLSLYGEVRNQPQVGYLSTIESLVYALKAVGEEDSKGLDGLLEVFGSMVGDQRRCKDERLSRDRENSDS